MEGIHQFPVNSPHKGQWGGALMLSLICIWLNGWVNNHEAGNLRHYRAHYDVSVMNCQTDVIHAFHEFIYIYKLAIMYTTNEILHITEPSSICALQSYIWLIQHLYRHWNSTYNSNIDGLVQTCTTSIANISMVSCQKGPTHHVSMADRALLSGYPRFRRYHSLALSYWHHLYHWCNSTYNSAIF